MSRVAFDLATRRPLDARGEAFHTWALDCWHRLGYPGAKLAEAILAATAEPQPYTEADNILDGALEAGWIERGKHEPCHSRRAFQSLQHGAKFTVDHFLMPRYKCEAFFDWLFPDMDPATREACAKQYGWAVSKKAERVAAKKEEPGGLRFTATRAELLPHLAACARVSDQKSAMAFCKCVLVESVGSGLVFRASRITEAIARDLKVAAARPGKAMVNAKDLLSFVASLGTGAIDVADIGKRLEIKQGGRRYTLPLYDVDTMPAHVIVEPQGCEVGAAPLARALGKVAPAMSEDESKPSQYGARVLIGGGAMQVSAFAGNISGVVTVPCDGAFDAFIPPPATRTIAGLIESEDSVRLAKVGSSVHVFSSAGHYSAQVCADPSGVEAQAISYFAGRKAYPMCRADRKTMLAAAKSIGACANTESPDADKTGAPLRMTVYPSAGGLTFSAAGDKSDGTEEVAATNSLRSFNVSARYMPAGLAFHDSEEIAIHLDPAARKDGAYPGYLVFSDPAGDDALPCLFIAGPIVYDAKCIALDPG